MASTVEHGIEYATYSGGHGEPYYKPCMGCICGWDTGRCDSWEDAGREFDDHLARGKKQQFWQKEGV